MRRIEMSDMMFGTIREQLRKEREEQQAKVRLITRGEEQGFPSLTETQRKERLRDRDRASARAGELTLILETLDAAETF